MHRLTPRAFVLALTAALLAGCVPEANGSLAFQSSPSNAVLFECADEAVNSLHQHDEQWNTRVTMRDVSGGRFETGQFEEANVMGYRVRLKHENRASQVLVQVRAAGPYFTDLGANDALVSFNTALAGCVAQRAPRN